MKIAEFDSYADGYSGGMEDPVKRLIGRNFDTFIRIKAEWLLRYLKKHVNQPIQPLRLLDFGCGTGELLRCIHNLDANVILEGCDVSEEMLNQAKLRWTSGKVPPLHRITMENVSLESDPFDLVITCCVFHHIRPFKRSTVFKELKKLLLPGGLLVVMEHNPWNPITQWMVKRAEIDRDAELLGESEVSRLMREAAIEKIHASYFLFFPPRFPVFQHLERPLFWLPLGGQYAVVGRRKD